MEEEINLIEVARTLWKGRRIVLRFVAAFAAIGLLLALATPDEYTAKTVIVTRAEARGSASGNLGGLAALVGINLGSSMDAISELTPVDYPEFIQSLSFQKTLMHTPLTWQKYPGTISLYEYFDKYHKPPFLEVVRRYTIGLPRVIVDLFRKKENQAASSKTSGPDDGLVYLTNAEQAVRGILTRKLKLTLNPENNFITLEARAPEARAAAQLVRKAREVLQEKVTELKINKASQNLQFTQSLYDGKKEEFEKAQNRLAQFRDRNIHLDTEMGRAEEERLSSEYQIAFSVYNEMAKQLENAKIRVKEDTPIFSVIEEAIVPNVRSDPRIERILLIWIFLGGVAGLMWVLVGRFLQEARKKWAEKS